MNTLMIQLKKSVVYVLFSIGQNLYLFISLIPSSLQNKGANMINNCNSYIVYLPWLIPETTSRLRAGEMEVHNKQREQHKINMYDIILQLIIIYCLQGSITYLLILLLQGKFWAVNVSATWSNPPTVRKNICYLECVSNNEFFYWNLTASGKVISGKYDIWKYPNSRPHNIFISIIIAWTILFRLDSVLCNNQK